MNPIESPSQPEPESYNLHEVATSFADASPDEAVDQFGLIVERHPLSIGYVDRVLGARILGRAGLVENPTPQILDKDVLEHLMPLAFNWQRSEQARRLADALPNETTKAYCYRWLYMHSGKESDAEQYFYWAQLSNPRCLPAQVELGKHNDVFENRTEMLIDVAVLSSLGEGDEVAQRVFELIPEELNAEVGQRLRKLINLRIHLDREPDRIN